MEYKTDIQSLLFRKISDQLPQNILLVDEIAEFLRISNDSAYRRIRGEKPLSLNEVVSLCDHYHLSLDDSLHNKPETITFRSLLLKENSFVFADYFNEIEKILQTTSHSQNPEIIFVLNELNLLQMLQIPEIIAFKIFFWTKTNLHSPESDETVFSLDDIDSSEIERVRNTLNYYLKIPTIELTTEESLTSFLKQILFFHEAGYFSSSNDARLLCLRLLDLLKHTQKQAAAGTKFLFNATPSGDENNYSLYYNDFFLTDNLILIKTDNFHYSCITSNAINLLQSPNPEFYDYNYSWTKNLIKKSILISGTAERERKVFFYKQKKKVEEVMNRL